MDQVGRLPDFQIAAALIGRTAPAGPPRRQIGRQQEEPIPLGRSQDEGIAQAPRAHRRLQDRLRVVQWFPLQRVVALRHREAQLLALDRVGDEIDEQIGLFRVGLDPGGDAEIEARRRGSRARRGDRGGQPDPPIDSIAPDRALAHDVLTRAPIGIGQDRGVRRSPAYENVFGCAAKFAQIGGGVRQGDAAPERRVEGRKPSQRIRHALGDTGRHGLGNCRTARRCRDPGQS